MFKHIILCLLLVASVATAQVSRIGSAVPLESDSKTPRVKAAELRSTTVAPLHRVFPYGRVLIYDTIVIGNGTSASNSTEHALIIEGQGMGANSGELAYNPAGTVLEWRGAAGKPMIEIRGPITSVQVRNLAIECNARCNGILALHVVHSDFQRVSITRPLEYAVQLRSTRAAQSGVAVGAGGNYLARIRVQLTEPNSAGFILGAPDVGSIGSSANVLEQTSVLCSNAPGQIGYLLRHTDYVHIRMAQAYYCEKSLHVQPPKGMKTFPQAIYLEVPSFDRPPTWDPSWDPSPAVGILLDRYHREWTGGPAHLETSWGPLMPPTHPAVWGTDNVRR